MRNIQGIFKKRKNSGFLSDIPIKHPSLDKYKREKNATFFSQQISQTYSDEAIAIGITGEWGVGKTSFINLVSDKLPDKDFIQINFNPWISYDGQNIHDSFFKTVEQELKIFGNDLSSNLAQYAKLVSANYDNNLIKIGTDLVNIFQNKSISERFEQINLLVKNIGKRIIIYIDDLDRLQKGEIIQVTKLIRNTANFSNTIFIVAYDREYIINAFEDFGKEKSHNYLEKIFQIEIELPNIDSSIIRKELVNKLNNRLPKDHFDEINKLYSPNSSTAYPFLDLILTTLRDVNRFINVFTYQYNQIQSEVNFTDFFNITLLRIKYPHLVDYLYKNKDKFFTDEDFSYNRLYLKMDGDQTKLRKALIEKRDITEGIIELFEECIQLIFGQPITSGDPKEQINKFNLIYFSNRSNNSIVNNRSFYRYFTKQIFSYDIADSEWENVLSLPYTDLIKKFKDWVRRGARNELYSRLKNLLVYATEENFENLVKSIFDLADFNIEIDPHETEAWFDYEWLFQILYRKDILEKRFYSGNIEHYEKFLYEILSKREESPNFVSGFISLICNDPNYYRGFALSKEKLLSINVEYFRNHIKETPSIKKQTWNLFYSCSYTDIDKNNNVLRPIADETKTIMKDKLFELGLNYFAKDIVIERNEKGYSNIYRYIFEIFQDFSELLSFVEKFEPSDHRDELLDFIQKCEEKGPDQYIDYKFNKITFD